MELKDKSCEPCRVGAPRATPDEIATYLGALVDWRLENKEVCPRIARTFTFTKYAESLDFVNRVASCAEKEGHHPVMLFEFRQVTVRWWTHKIEGLHLNDFVMAAKCDSLYAEMKASLK